MTISALRVVVFLSALVVTAAIVAPAQSGGRFEEAKRMAMAYIKSEQFDKAAGRLEEVWEQDQSDPMVAEYLAVAYLNTLEKRSLPTMEKRAFALIEKLVADNARVTFLVHHSHEKAAWIQGRQLHQYCSGAFSIMPGRVVYLAEKGTDAEKHSFDINIRELRSISVDENDDRGVFHVKVPKGSYIMASRNRNSHEAKFLVHLVKKI